jgi:hypothetical protein
MLFPQIVERAERDFALPDCSQYGGSVTGDLSPPPLHQAVLNELDQRFLVSWWHSIDDI